MTAPAAEKKKEDIRSHSQRFLHGFDQPFNDISSELIFTSSSFPERRAGVSSTIIGLVAGFRTAWIRFSVFSAAAQR